MAAAVGAVDLRELAEDLFAGIGRDADATVLHFDADAVLDAGEAHLDLFAPAATLDDLAALETELATL